MYRFELLLSSVGALFLLSCAGTAGLLAEEPAAIRGQSAIVLVAQGKSLVPIILPAKPTRYTKIAATDLAEYLGKVGGEKPKILEGVPNPIPEHAIWVGGQPVLKELFPGTDFDLKHPEEILLKCDGKHLIIVGRDIWDPLTNKMKILGGKTEAERKNYLAGFAEANGDVNGFQYEYGTVNAVYTFLQDKLGIRWLWPGAEGEVVPKQTQVTLGSFELRYHPQIRMRQTVYAQLAIYKKGGEPGQSGGDWVRRQRVQLDSLYAPSGGHGFTEWYAAYHKTHPEYFALQSDGTREYKGEPRHAKICQTNPAVSEQWLKIMAEMNAKNPHRTVFNVAANDSTGSGICCCDRCKAWDHPEAAKMIWNYPGGKELVGNATSDREVTFANLLARKLKERYPDKDYKVLIQAYGGAASPPIEAIPDANVIVSSVAAPFSNLEGWSRVTTGGLIWRPNFADPAHFKTGGPPDITGAGALFQKAAACGATGVSLDMLWSWWATQGPMYYLMAQLAWNPDRSVDEIMNDYYQAGFGPAAKDIEAYWKLLESNRIAIQPDKSTAGVKSWAEAFDPEFFLNAYALLDSSAVKAAQAGSEYSARVAFVRAGLDYLRLNTENQSLVKQIIEAKTPERDAIEKMRANWKLIEEINQKHPEALSINRLSELGYIHPAADHKELERKLQTKAALRDRKNARTRELNPK
ncbi:hypothetical protein ETAA8_37660 [Anatilimnocola aggregata]|uniref:Uncharacterized protein n=1 Tax=Anatilimnocola aggregata TaxID=2528021 RepID=A0A517YEL2_9BACT|nr:DUF4838 domain-containing protein [Anatilimnocola aggregata]QDU28663.1 hypothetical protein ETAA8_37660 [Anatilimnocola aggregata]